MQDTQARFVVCRLDDLDDPGSKGGTLVHRDQAHDVFVVRRNGRLYGYLNTCPHTGAPLAWVPDQFLDIERTHIQCAMHGALFRPEDGLCVAGPCSGDRLTMLPVVVESGDVVMYMSPPNTEPK
jgi:nitrite reductase/ring-hydroxylating ferredoxin subunit